MEWGLHARLCDTSNLPSFNFLARTPYPVAETCIHEHASTARSLALFLVLDVCSLPQTKRAGGGGNGPDDRLITWRHHRSTPPTTFADNQEAQYYGFYSSNHGEHAEAYFGPILDWMPAAKLNALGHCAQANFSCPPNALHYACHLAPWGYQSRDTSTYSTKPLYASIYAP